MSQDDDFDIGGGFDDDEGPEEMDDLMEDDVMDEPEEEQHTADNSAPTADDDDEGGAEPARKRTKKGDAAGQQSSHYSDMLDSIPRIAGEEAWLRPPMPAFNPATTALHLQTMEADYTVGAARSFPGYPEEFSSGSHKKAIVRLFGVSRGGQSVLCHIHNFLSYFYIPVWATFSTAGSDLSELGEALNQELKDQSRGDKSIARPIIGMEVVSRQSIWGYHFTAQQQFIRIIVAIPALVATGRRILERGIKVGQSQKQFKTYESNLPYVLRFMVDKDVTGGGWITLPAGSYDVRPRGKTVSRCGLEVDVDYRALIAHESEGEWIDVAPLRLLSFDIECAGRKGHFPKPELDPVIQIACCLSDSHSISEPHTKLVFTLHSCAPIVGAHVVACDTEEQLLLSWLRFFLLSDSDLITGYNIINFDFPYLLDRAKALKLNTFPYLGRIRNSQSTMKNKKFESKAFGIRENKEIKMEGRIQFDCLDVIRREYKLRSYTLNSVCAHFLNQQKEDVHYSIIGDLQAGNAETRRRLAEYCLKDSLLPLRLMDKLMLMVNFIEMARVTGVPIVFLLTRGQQIKVVSQLYRKARQHQLVIPVRDSKGLDDKYEGATVIEPKKAFYTVPIATLDFASLYPSIMMAHNLCYSTLVAPADVHKLQPDEFVKTPTGDVFVRHAKRKGVLPEILVELLEARARAKKAMKSATDPFVAAVLNGRQLGLKISANSVYGFTGAQVGQLPCIAISSSTTAFGRDMIMHAKAVVESHYTRANGYEFDCDVVYGDTDSVMVRFGTSKVEEAMRLGAEAATLVSKQFISPIRLEFEKVYYPYLLMNKKRYAGLYWTQPLQWDKMDTKGIETVRRDNCALVSNVISRCLDLILIDRNVESALEYVKRTIADLLTNRLDLSLLVISKSLGKSAHSTDYRAKQAHVELAERMRKRDPRSAPAVGDRVAYVICKAAKGAPAYEKAEDPIYVLEHDIPIDTAYYLSNQLTLPLQRLFEPVLPADKLQSLFTGAHTRQIKVSTPTTGGIMKFAVKRRTCLGCKVPLTAADGANNLCKHCLANRATLYMTQIEKVREHEELYCRTWTQCQSCQGSLHQEVLCTSRDCPIFYRRKKVQKDLNEAQVSLERFAF